MEMTIAQCMEYDRREWLDCIHKSDRTQETQADPSPRVSYTQKEETISSHSGAIKHYNKVNFSQKRY